MQKNNFKLFIRNFIFGVEDGMVSTVGALSGIAVAGMPKSTILLVGIILIFVEAFSMGAGSLISEHSSEEYASGKHKAVKRHYIAAVIMFFSYFGAGFIPLLPYVLAGAQTAFWISIVISLLALFSLGAINAKIFKIKIWHHALELLFIGGAAVMIGVLAGRLVMLLQ